jgi:hypothetical protein
VPLDILDCNTIRSEDLHKIGDLQRHLVAFDADCEDAMRLQTFCNSDEIREVLVEVHGVRLCAAISAASRRDASQAFNAIQHASQRSSGPREVCPFDRLPLE